MCYSETEIKFINKAKVNDLEVVKQIVGMTGNQNIDNLMREVRKNSYKTSVKLQKAKNDFYDCCIKDLLQNAQRGL